MIMETKTEKEIEVIRVMVVALLGLDEKTQKRVLWYLNDRFIDHRGEISTPQDPAEESNIDTDIQDFLKSHLGEGFTLLELDDRFPNCDLEKIVSTLSDLTSKGTVSEHRCPCLE
jgi:hypothetical protein